MLLFAADPLEPVAGVNRHHPHRHHLAPWPIRRRGRLAIDERDNFEV
jgi:hypothetical protein